MLTECPSDKQLLDHVRGKGSNELLESITSHVKNCRHCDERLGRLIQVSAVSRDGHDERIPPTVLLDKQEWETSAASTASPHSHGEKDGERLPSHESTIDMEDLDTDDNHRSTVARTPSPGLPSIDNYDMLGVIGRGGMGIVVKARQSHLNRDVAIKFPRHVTDELDRERFLREARAAGSLRHPHICPIYEVGESASGPYLVMAFIEGATLRAWRNESRTTRESAEMTARLARAAQYAHEHGIIHRDLKPENVLVDAATGQPVLTDFGLAKELGAQGDGMTQSGQVIGTPAYMAPEQAAGKTGEIGPRADVYSLGAILYELLCKQPPFKGAVGDVLRQVQTEEPPPPRRLAPSVHRDIETICVKAMNKVPSLRYQSAGEMAEDLERFSRGEAIVARRESPVRKITRHLRRHRQVYGVATMIVVVAAIAVSALAISSTRSARQAQLADLQRDLNEGINQPPELWRAAHVEHLHAVNARMDPLDPSGRVNRRQAIDGALSKAIQVSFNNTARIEAEEESRLRELIEVVRNSASHEADELQTGLEERLARPELVFELTTPVLPGDPAFELEQIACRGNVELTAQFAPNWKSASRVGLILNATDRQQYEFLVATTSAANPPRSVRTFGDLMRRALTARVIIQRREGSNVVVLRDEAVALGSLDGKPLRIKATRKGQRLSVWIDKLKPVEFDDLFPVHPQDRGVFSLVWPSKVQLTSVRAYRQTRPVSSSPLLTGDTAFADGDFDTALAEYRRQQTADDSDIRREVLFKQALCYVHLSDDDSARKTLSQVIAQKQSGDDPWSLRAACQFWLLELKADHQEAAKTRFMQLKVLHQGLSFGRLATLISASDRQAILSRYDETEDWLFFTSQTVENLENVNEIRSLLNAGEANRFFASIQLVKAYRLAGREEDARRLCEEMIDEFDEFLIPYHGFAIMLIEQYGWLMRNQGSAGCHKAIEVLDHWARDSQGMVRDGGWHWTLVERARLNAATGDMKQADQDLREFFAQLDFGADEYSVFLSAGLLQGFIQVEQGDSEGGRMSWQTALAGEGYKSQSIAGSFSPLVSRSIMASLADQVTDDEIDRVINWLLSVAPKGSKLYFGLAVARLPRSPIKSRMKPLALHMWQSESGRELARRVAFRNLSYREYLYEPIYLAGWELIQQRILGTQASTQQHQLCLELMRNAHAAMANEKQLRGHIQAIGEMVLLTPSRATWDLIRPELSEHREIQATLAYLCGKRCQFLNNSDDAQAFFAIALESAPSQSLVAELTRAERAE